MSGLTVEQEIKRATCFDDLLHIIKRMNDDMRQMQLTWETRLATQNKLAARSFMETTDQERWNSLMSKATS